MGLEPHGFCTATTRRIGQEVARVVRGGTEVLVVIGGGNIFRGSTGRKLGLDPSASDTMGMLATVMNGVMFRDVLRQEEVDAVLFSAVPLPSVCETWRRDRVLAHIQQKKVCIGVAGTGNPFFTTDTAAVLRAMETRCDAVLKATKVPGVFSADPLLDQGAQHYPTLSCEEALQKNLKVMDRTALALAQDGQMPVVVFSVLEEGALEGVLEGKGQFTILHPGGSVAGSEGQAGLEWLL